ncbi:MAG: hypothetical protein Q8Q89_04440 [bacterium]|nr:hypothetical protein [bacterium]
MNWLKENWFKLGMLIVATSFVIGFIFINYQEYNLERVKIEMDALEWATKNAPHSFEKFIGRRELENFEKQYWRLFNQPF